eukprot:836226_1
MPADWLIDEPGMVADPEETMPDEWLIDEPGMVADPEKTMPDEWLIDEPGMVAETEATIPEGWDEKDDGDLEAHLIVFRQTISTARRSAAGVWVPRKVSSPDYFEGAEPSKQLRARAIIGVGMDIWTMTTGRPPRLASASIISRPCRPASQIVVGIDISTIHGAYDNFYVGSDLAYAKEFADIDDQLKTTVTSLPPPVCMMPNGSQSDMNSCTNRNVAVNLFSSELGVHVLNHAALCGASTHILNHSGGHAHVL